jgi:hypothetical protein
VKAVERELAAEERSRVALELTNHTKTALELIKEEQAALAVWEAAVVEGEANLATHQEELAARTRGLQEQEASLQTRKAKVEEYLAERSTSIDRIMRWAGEVNPSLDALRLSPIRVAEAPPSLGTIFRCWTLLPSVYNTWSPPSSTSWRQKGGRSPEEWWSTFLPASGAMTPPSN